MSSDDRESILSRVRGALAPLHERAHYPDYADDIAVMRSVFDGRDLWSIFADRIKSISGLALDRPEALTAWLRERGWMHGYCDPALWPRLAPHFGAGFQVETEFDRTRVDDYAFGITRAAGAIAESGTVILTDRGTSRRLAALTPWVHVAVLKRDEIFATMAQAVEAMGNDPNVIWCSGPSKTSDVEGILIEGVHGPGAQIALVMD
jgi:L-lactate dehydrogenase complex protein LldG